MTASNKWKGEGMPVTGVDQSTESTDKAQAHWFDEVVTHSGILRASSSTASYDAYCKTLSASFSVVGPKLAGHFYFNYKAFTIKYN